MKSSGQGGLRGPPTQIHRSTHSRGVPRPSSQGAPFLILKPSIEVTIRLTQPEFPSHRWRGPLRLAELQAYTEFMNGDRAGRALYQVKTSRNVPELDFAALIDMWPSTVPRSKVASTSSPVACGSASPMTGRLPSRAL